MDYFNTFTVHLLLFYTMTNECTIISQIMTLLQVSILIQTALPTDAFEILV